MRIDLHNHTKHSDGVYTVKELIERAVLNKVDIFALTDHDSVFGVNEIMALAKNYPVKVIPGMELSTFYKGENVHIVCLFKGGIIPKEIMDFSMKHALERRNRSIKMMENITRIFGLKVDIPGLLAENEVITRGNMLRSIMKLNGLGKEEAWKYLASDSPAYIPSSRLSTEEGLAFVKKNNCFCILAHPGYINRAYLNDILAYGFDGIEAYYPNHSSEEVLYFKKLAKEYDLAVSAGSDCHGDSTHADIGNSTLNEAEFQIIWDKIK